MLDQQECGDKINEFIYLCLFSMRTNAYRITRCENIHIKINCNCYNKQVTNKKKKAVTITLCLQLYSQD